MFPQVDGTHGNPLRSRVPRFESCWGRSILTSKKPSGPAGRPRSPQCGSATVRHRKPLPADLRPPIRPRIPVPGGAPADSNTRLTGPPLVWRLAGLAAEAWRPCARPSARFLVWTWTGNAQVKRIRGDPGQIPGPRVLAAEHHHHCWRSSSTATSSHLSDGSRYKTDTERRSAAHGKRGTRTASR
jgi:hypothetical protein